MSLLLVFDGLIRLGKMSAVAAELGLTQSAVSHAVGRLRDVFDDALFVRRGPGVEPTPRALEIAVPISRAVDAVRSAVRIGRVFEPAAADRLFRVAAIDSVIAALAPRLLEVFAALAPGCSVSFRTFGHLDAERAVSDGLIDLAVGVFPNPPEGTVARPLRGDGFRVACRRDHPDVAGPLDLDTYCRLGHLLVSPSGHPRGTVDDALERIGRSRRIVAVMPQFLSALMTTSRTDAIVTAPSLALHKLGPLFDLAVHDAPLAIPRFTLSSLSRRDVADDPALVWFGERVADVLADGS